LAQFNRISSNKNITIEITIDVEEIFKEAIIIVNNFDMSSLRAP